MHARQLFPVHAAFECVDQHAVIHQVLAHVWIGE
jgi:hypothetical protein